MSIHLATEIPGPKSRELMRERITHVARGPFHSTPVFAARAQGALLHDVDGNTFIDFAAGIGVANVGHAPRELVEAIQEQATRMLHTSFNVMPYEGYLKVAAALNRLLPGEFPKKTLLVNSGAEAVENAIKIARAYTRRSSVVCFEHAFHGRTYMAMSLTAKVKPYRQDFGPFATDIYRVPFPYAYRWPGTQDPAEVADACFARFDEIVSTQVGAHNVAAVIIEPVLGEGGFVPAPAAFMRRLRDYCTQQGIVLIADEVQSGFGRTGSMFACEQLGVVPDLTTLAKGLAGGMPLAAVCGRAAIMDAPMEGGIGGTYGGNPLACAAALAVIERFADGTLLKHAVALGRRIETRFQEWQEKYSLIGDVRGLGPMRALELVKDRSSKEPHREATAALIKYCYEKGLIVLSAGTFGNVLRLLPPLVIEAAELDEGLSVIEAGLQTLSKEYGL
jgi:4-aminobutyrate aminotransferase/(S)-3-amino-2-methylpropionate transaminase